MNFGYFRDGLLHFICGLIFLAVYFRARCRREDFSLFVVVGLLAGSSALFFLPGRLPFLSHSGNFWFRFLHYPLPDWDILLLGGKWHRLFLSHSVFVVLFLGGLSKNAKMTQLFWGMAIGVASHLFWDAISSANPLIVFYPHYLFFRGIFAKIWLYMNALALIFLADLIRRGADGKKN
jgi:hypothetical protein